MLRNLNHFKAIVSFCTNVVKMAKCSANGCDNWVI